MTDTMTQRLRLLLDSRDVAREVFPMRDGLLHLCAASVYALQGQAAQEERLRACKRLLKDRVGAFSYFRGAVEEPMAALLDVSGQPEQTLEDCLRVYELLKQDFHSSPYLPLTAFSLARLAPQARQEELAHRTRALYERMNREHPFLTSNEDSALCALLALSSQTDDLLIRDIEDCYTRLKPEFFSANAVQSLCHVMALFPGEAEEKCRRVLALRDAVKAAGRKWGTNYELPTLGIAALCADHPQNLTHHVVEADAFLEAQKGFGVFSSVSAAQRLMYAALLVLADEEAAPSPALPSSLISSTVSLILAQQAALCAAVTASVTVAAASRSSS